MVAKDPYSVLGVAKTASPDEIKSAYRKLARKFHPDVNPGSKKAEERFKEISAAHDILADTTKRALYDEFGPDGVREGFDPDAARAARRWSVHGAREADAPEGIRDFEGVGLDDLFGNFFSRSKRKQAQQKGADAEASLTIDFVQAVLGGEVGVTVRGEHGQRTLKVKIPPGIEDGARIRLAGQGMSGSANPGDLYVDIKIRSHPFFKRAGSTLLLDLPVRVSEAVSGAKVRVPTPRGEVTLTVPPGSQSGAQLRLKGKGVGEGDMIVTLIVQAPNDMSKEAAELALKLDAHYRTDLRAHIKL